MGRSWSHRLQMISIRGRSKQRMASSQSRGEWVSSSVMIGSWGQSMKEFEIVVNWIGWLHLD